MNIENYLAVVATMTMIASMVNTFAIQLPWYFDHLKSKEDDKHENWSRKNGH